MKRIYFESKSASGTYKDAKEEVFNKLISFLTEKECFNSEVVGQDDDIQIGAPELLGELIDILDFKVEFDD